MDACMNVGYGISLNGTPYGESVQVANNGDGVRMLDTADNSRHLPLGARGDLYASGG